MKLRDKPYSSLYNPKSAQIRGMRSALAPSSLVDGEYALIQNWRWDRKSLRVRDGIAELTSSAVVSGGTYRGHWSGLLNGTEHLVTAYLDGAAVKLYDIDLTNWTASEITAGAYAASTNEVHYENTRMSDKFCSFAAVRDNNTERDVLIISNGEDDPRVYDPLAVGLGAQVAIHAPIALPTAALSHKTVPKFPVYWPVAGASLPTYSELDPGRFSLSDNGSSPNNNARMLADTTVNANDWVKFEGTTDLDLSNGRQLIFLADDGGNTNVWDNFKVEISENGSTYYTLWDPATQEFDHVTVPISPTETKYLIAFSHDHVASADKNAIRYIKISYVGTIPNAADITVDFYGLFGGGFVEGGSEYGWAYYHSAARSESVGVLVATGEGKRVKDMGGTPLNNLKVPVSPLIYYAYDVPYVRATAAQLTAGTNKLRIYRRDEGGDCLYLAEEKVESTFGSSWSTTEAGELRYETQGTESEPLDITQALPDAYHQTIPKGKYIHAANDRLFAGNIKDAASQVWFSEDRDPFRFRAIIRTDSLGNFDPRCGSSFECGTDIVQGFASVPADSAGLNSVFIFTNAALCQVEGLDSFSLSKIRRKAQLGTLSPRSIGTYRDAVFWVDADMQLRSLSGGGIEELSRYTVDDKLQAVPNARRDDIVVTFFKDRLYLAYSTSVATTNDRVLLWNAIERTWEADDKIKTPCTAEGLGVRMDMTNSKPRLLAFASNAKIYEYEQALAEQDLGSNIETKLTTGDLALDLFQDFHVHCLGFMIDDVASGTISVVVTYKPFGQTQTFESLNVDVATNQAHLWLNQVPTWGDETKDTGGVAGQIDISGNLRGGKVLHSIALEAETRGSRARKVT